MIVSLSRIEELCTDQGMTLYALSKKSKVSYPSIYKYAKGKKNIESMPLSTAMRLAKALGVAIEDLYESPEVNLQDGWNDITPDFSVYVENGKILHGVEKGNTVYPYKKHGSDFTLASNSSIEEFDELIWHPR